MGIVNREEALFMATGFDTSGLGADAKKAIKIFQEISESATKSGEKANDAITLMKTNLERTIPVQKQIVAKLKKELESLEGVFSKVNVGTQDPKAIEERNKLSQAVKNLRAELKAEEEELAARERIYTNMSKGLGTLRTSLNKITNEMARMKIAGQENTEQYKELEKQAGQLQNTFKELRQEQKAFTSGGMQLQGFIDGLGMLSGLLASGAGAIGLFNASSEEYAKIQTKVQSLISLTIGLQQIQNTLHETSAFRVHTVTKAKELWISANQKLAVSLGISNMAAKVLMGTLSLGLSVAIGFAISAIDKFVSKQREAREAAEKFNEAISNSVTPQIAVYEKLRVTYSNLGDTIKEKEKFIHDNKSAFEQLGISVSTVQQADELFIRQTDAFKQAMIERAKATAAAELAAERYKEAMLKQFKLEQTPDIGPSSYTIGGGVFSGTTMYSPGNAAKKAKMKKEAEDMFAEAENFINKQVGHENSAIDILNKLGILPKNDEKTKNKIKTNFENIRKDILKYEQEYQDKLKELSDSAEQARINRMQDDHERELTQLKFDYDRRLDLINKSEQKELEKLIEIEKQKSILRGDKNFNPQNVKLPSEMSSVFNALRSDAANEHTKNVDKYFDSLISKYQSHEQQRNAIVEKYAKERRIIEEKNVDGTLNKNIKQLDKQESEELAQFDTQIQEKTSIMIRMFSDMSNKSIEELKKIRDESEELWAFLSDGKWSAQTGTSFGITKEMFDDIISSPEKLSKFKKGLDDIKDSIFTLDTPINQIKEGLKELFDPQNNGTNKQLQALGKIQQGYQKYADAVSLVSDAVGALGELSNSGALERISEGLSDVLSVAGDTMKGVQAGAQVGGAAGAVVGGILGAAKSVFTILSRNKKHREELQKQIKENQDKEYFGQLEIEELYRQKYEWAKKIGETTLSYIKREGDELKKQGESNVKTQNELWSKLLQTQYKSGEHFQKTGLFGWGKGKIVEEWTSLAGKSWAQIEQLAAQGKLSEEGRKFYEALKKAKDEGKDIENMQVEYLEKLRETYTGSSYESVVSGIVEAFKQGKRSATDFAKSFEDLMQGAIESSLQLLTDQKMRRWYEQFAESGKDGYTKDEIEKAKQDWIKLNENLAEQAKQLEEVTGIKIGDIKSGVTGELKQAMTEGTGSMLVGLWNMSAMDGRETKNAVFEILSMMRNDSMPNISQSIYSLLNEMHQIETNTHRTANNTDYMKQGFLNLEDKLEDIKRNTKPNTSRG